MLKAYFDDSGQDEQAIGGCVAFEAAWESLELAWRKALHDFRLDWFHAVDFERRKPGFDHLNDSERTALLNELLQVLRENIGVVPYGAYICAITPADIVAGIAELRAVGDAGLLGHSRGVKPRPYDLEMERYLALLEDPFCHCLGTCFRLLMDRCVLLTEDDRVHMLFADQPHRSGKIASVYAMATSNLRFENRLVGLSHGAEMNPRRIVPLQVADFAAYYLALLERRPDGPRAWVGKQLWPRHIGHADGLWLTDGWR